MVRVPTSAFHRLKSDEIWHFYEGASITIFAISPVGTLTKTLVGNNPEKGERFQLLIPKGFWFAPKAFLRDGLTLKKAFSGFQKWFLVGWGGDYGFESLKMKQMKK